MPDNDSYTLCPDCASPNTFEIGERGTDQDRQVKRECVCGEVWWSGVKQTPLSRHILLEVKLHPLLRLPRNGAAPCSRVLMFHAR